MPSSLELSLPAPRSGWRASIIASLRENSPIYLLIALYLIGADSLSAWVGTPHRSFDRIVPRHDGYIGVCTAALAFAFIIWIVHLSLVRKISIQTGEASRLVGKEFFSSESILL